MEKPVPMDRLICGDVGYGKTEIAVRAAFKAVQDGKQVAVLVPTTLLAQQHFNTFSERYAPFPVSVKPMSRFQTDGRGGGDPARARRRDRRRGHRHPPAAVAGDPVQAARPGDHRRGAAVRRRAQGVPQAAADRGGRARDVGHADPAHAGDGRGRDPRDVDHPDAAGGAAPGADVRRRLRREADRGGHPARAAPRRPGLLRAQPGAVDQEGRRAAGGARARGAHRGRARADERARARADHGGLLGPEVRRAGGDDDRGERARHPEREHADRGPGRRGRAVPAAPAPRPGRARAGSGPTRTSSTRRRSR